MTTIHLHWYDDHKNLAALWEWLEHRGEEPGDGPAYFMEKPYNWTPEWEQMQEEEASGPLPA